MYTATLTATSIREKEAFSTSFAQYLRTHYIFKDGIL